MSEQKKETNVKLLTDLQETYIGASRDLQNCSAGEKLQVCTGTTPFAGRCPGNVVCDKLEYHGNCQTGVICNIDIKHQCAPDQLLTGITRCDGTNLPRPCNNLQVQNDCQRVVRCGNSQAMQRPHVPVNPTPTPCQEAVE
jgi:hypothetical protein